MLLYMIRRTDTDELLGADLRFRGASLSFSWVLPADGIYEAVRLYGARDEPVLRALQSLMIPAEWVEVSLKPT